jgi:hypothetical protein
MGREKTEGGRQEETAGRTEGRLPCGSTLVVGGTEKGSGWRGRFYQLTTFTDRSVTD